jgi:hypothetical protein
MDKSRNKRAISHIIAATMLVAVAMIVAFVTFLFVMNYVGATTTKSGRAITIQAINTANENLTVYVQNVGTETLTLDPTNCIYINGVLKDSTIAKTTLLEGDTATLTVNGLITQLNNLTVKVTTTDGTTTKAILQ